MKTITISEKEFNRIFDVHGYDYKYDLKFMEPHETQTIFKKQKVCKILTLFRQTLKQLKNDLERSEFSDR